MSLGVHSLQELTPCYPQRASATFVMAFVLQKCSFRKCRTSRFYLITLSLLGSTRSLTLLNVPGNPILPLRSYECVAVDKISADLTTKNRNLKVCNNVEMSWKERGSYASEDL
jgi:hypothetical protein